MRTLQIAYERACPTIAAIAVSVVLALLPACNADGKVEHDRGSGIHIPILSDIANAITGKKQEVSQTVADPFAWTKPVFMIVTGLSLAAVILPLGFRREGVIGICAVLVTQTAMSLLDQMRGLILLVGLVLAVLFFGPSLWWRLQAVWTAKRCVHKIKNGGDDREKREALEELAEAKEELQGLFGKMMKKISPSVAEADSLVDWQLGPPVSDSGSSSSKSNGGSRDSLDSPRPSIPLSDV